MADWPSSSSGTIGRREGSCLGSLLPSRNIPGCAVVINGNPLGRVPGRRGIGDSANLGAGAVIEGNGSRQQLRCIAENQVTVHDVSIPELVDKYPINRSIDSLGIH